MAARILLPNGTLATLVGRTWHCADLEAIPVLDYFSSRVPTVVYRSKEETRARGVAEILVGAQYLDCDTRLWFPPDVVV